MGKTDWKDLLGSLAPENESPATAAETKSANNLNHTEARVVTGTKQELVIRFEKRNGKPATIVSKYQGTENELKALAATLKKHCGTGGSAKDDEILIQGDVRLKVAEYLRNQGHRVKGDFKK